MSSVINHAASDSSEFAQSPYSFSLLIRSQSLSYEQLEDAIFNAGCGDALLHSRGEHVFVDFERTGATAEEVILGAVANVESIAGVAVVKVLPPSATAINNVNAVLRTRRVADHKQMRELLDRKPQSTKVE
jgi:hypothetical protein